MQAKFKFFKAGFGMKWRSMNYEERREFEAWVSNKLDMLHDEMMDWQPVPKPDSIEGVLDIIEDAVTGELPENLKPHAGDPATPDDYAGSSDDKPKRRGKK